MMLRRLSFCGFLWTLIALFVAPSAFLYPFSLQNENNPLILRLVSNFLIIITSNCASSRLLTLRCAIVLVAVFWAAYQSKNSFILPSDKRDLEKSVFLAILMLLNSLLCALALDQSEMRKSILRKRLVQFYERHNPEKAAFAGTLLEKYKGREDELFQRLHEKYNGFISTSGRGELKATEQPDDQSTSCGYVPPLLRSQYDSRLNEAIEDARRAQEERVHARIAKFPGRMDLLAKMRREI
uniref:AlNc14C454G11754 protein n=1 Tax=Albugo laibachii Nc14 TaxID=890382 RepID=F0X012_9STRA|nr:AlNc14C454G11754 [Albugo laibachii Nc14]|eukprot:CCA27094.1 AlNc14C454G11754 [Albugo laibachii Nc14]